MQAQQAELRKRRAPAPPPAKTPTTEDSQPPASVSVLSAQLPDHKNKYYAVAKRRRVGIFTTWKETERSVRGFSGAIHTRFCSERAAIQWLAEQNRMDDASDLSNDGTQQDATVYGDGRRHSVDAIPKPPIIDPSLAGPDPSVGKPMELYNTSIHVETDILKVLCPK
jgi:hypothetical protein